MAKVEQKQAVVNEIKEKLQGAQSAVLVDYRGLTVEQDTELRKKLREANVEYKVYKNTMLNFAIQGTDMEPLKDFLGGPTAIAISYDDPASGPRILNEVAEKNDALEFKAGVVENQLYDVEGIKKVAKIPPKDQLLATLFGSFKSPMASFARVVRAIAEKQEEGGETAE
ncbi:MAG: 50S ribosomal protein L10 [Epulopiscium sp.]|nr:50S ribosomal protein L10 [Candidatus Epulonipiscium sp.]